MTITRETLELAARAAGIDLYWQRHYAEDGPTPYAGKAQWNPLTDHGQLLHLAMACKIWIRPSLDCIEYSTWDRRLEVISVDCQDFPALAEAIITAAAEQQLAKEKKE